MTTKDSNENISENDISEFTNNAIFNGSLGLLSNKNSQNTSTNHPPPQQGQKILQNLPKIESLPNIPNSSIYSSGYISFRNKKTIFQNPNNNNNNKLEEIDPAIITQSILEKINSMKPTSSSHITYHNEQKEIGKMLNNNQYSKDFERELDERDLRNYNPNSSYNSRDNINYEKKEYLNEESEQSEQSDDRNLFWNMKSNINNHIIINEENSIEEKENSERIEEKREKYLNSIICTLSFLDKGKAIFVSSDDMIFVLPSLFIPKNLQVGNTYMFKVSEYENYSQKMKDINEIQEKYIKN